MTGCRKHKHHCRGRIAVYRRLTDTESWISRAERLWQQYTDSEKSRIQQSRSPHCGSFTSLQNLLRPFRSWLPGPENVTAFATTILLSAQGRLCFGLHSSQTQSAIQTFETKAPPSTSFRTSKQSTGSMIASFICKSQDKPSRQPRVRRSGDLLERSDPGKIRKCLA